jgi:amino acid adenylation domain-containing protein
MRQAAEAMLARYPNLRAAVCHEGLSKPVQAIARSPQLPWREVDNSEEFAQNGSRPRRPPIVSSFRCLATRDSALCASDDLQVLLAADRAERFSLSAGPLLRFTLARLARDRHLLVLTNHHILMDGWSLPVFFEEMLALYAGDSLAPARPYMDYLAWLQKQDTGKAYAQWKQYLSPVEEPTRIAPEPAGLWQAPIRWQRDLSADLTSRLQNLARERGITLNTIFQGLWAVLLWRLSGKSKVVFGVTVSGRPAALQGVERMVGLFINTLPLRADMNPREPLAVHLARIQQEQSAMQEFQHVSMAEIQRAAGLGELFDTLLVFENYPLDPAVLPRSAGIRIEEVEGRDTSHYPLSLIVVPGESLQLRLDYDPARFERSFAESIGARLVRLLEGAVAKPDALLHELGILEAAERRMLLEPQYRPLATPSVEATLPELFEAQVRRTPDKIALVYGEATLTYAELNDQANRLAHHLIDMGAGPEALVAFRLEPSFETVVAILGIQKAGGAYLPLDPEYPAARVQGMLADAQPICLLTADWFAENRAALAQADAANPRPALPGNTAYVIYTSGSTGTPKGVAVTHQNVARLFNSTSPWFSFGSDDVWTLFHSSAFDFSVWEIWGALLHGGRLVVAPKLMTRSPEEFLNLLAHQKVTVLNQTPSAFYQLMEADRENPDAGQRLSLRTVVFGGEALDLSRLDDWYSRHPDNAPVLVNMYGITETTVHVSYVALDRMTARQSRGSMIGGNIPDLGIYVLDGQLEPVPTGVTGEMYVTGAGLARGYLKRPGITAERFLPDPHGEPGTRMYRTGDLARWVVADSLEYRSLEYLGRADQQVKIRGFRIELGEIEAALAGLPELAQAAVIARDSGAGGRQLVAYVVPRAGAAFDAADLRRSLGEKLPDYMLPTAFVRLGALPLTQHGKLDRAALPAPAMSSGEARVTPRDTEEIAIAGVWEDVLRRGGIGVTDNFFALGGHSLLATQVMSRLRERCGVKLPLRVLFEQPTVEGLARSVRALKSPAEPARPQLRRVARQKRQITVNELGEVGQSAGSGN